MLPIFQIFLVRVVFIHRALIEVADSDPVVYRSGRVLLDVDHMLANHRVHLVHIGVVVLKDFGGVELVLRVGPTDHFAKPLERAPKRGLHI